MIVRSYGFGGGSNLGGFWDDITPRWLQKKAFSLTPTTKAMYAQFDTTRAEIEAKTARDLAERGAAIQQQAEDLALKIREGTIQRREYAQDLNKRSAALPGGGVQPISQGLYLNDAPPTNLRAPVTGLPSWVVPAGIGVVVIGGFLLLRKKS